MKTETTEIIKTYPLRNIQKKLWRSVKSKAAFEGRSVRDVIIGKLREYVADYNP